MRRILLLAFAIALLPQFSIADDFKPDDLVATPLVAEGFVTTQTARVVVAVQAALTGEAAAKARLLMQQAVQALANPAANEEWRLASFQRSQDEAGLERWVARYEVRLPEAELGGINDRAKASSKAGMQLAVEQIDFSPTLAETEAVRAKLRQEIYAQADAELKRLNAALPGRQFRIASISFDGASPPMPMQKMMRAEMMMASSVAMDAGAAPAEVAQRLALSAQVAFAALAPTETEEEAPSAPAVAPAGAPAGGSSGASPANGR